MDIPATCLALALMERDGAHGGGRAAFGRPPVTLAAAASAGSAARGAALFVPMGASTIVLAWLSSTFLVVARASSFLTKAATLTISVAAFPVAFAALCAFAVGGVSFTLVSFSPATVPVPFPVSVSTIAPFTFAMVLARRAVTLRVTVVVVRAFCKIGRRKEVSTMLWLSVSRRRAGSSGNESKETMTLEAS
jgi:hypothetical protein